jgi:hypothetical protein
VTSRTGGGVIVIGLMGAGVVVLLDAWTRGCWQAEQWLASGLLASPHSSQKRIIDDCCIGFSFIPSDIDFAERASMAGKGPQVSSRIGPTGEKF